jgi:hypothetical protein
MAVIYRGIVELVKWEWAGRSPIVKFGADTSGEIVSF